MQNRNHQNQSSSEGRECVTIDRLLFHRVVFIYNFLNTLTGQNTHIVEQRQGTHLRAEVNVCPYYSIMKWHCGTDVGFQDHVRIIFRNLVYFSKQNQL